MPVRGADSLVSAGAGKQVKACYGTTKYCNAFLKGMPCNNTDCLYLHAEGTITHS